MQAYAKVFVSFLMFLNPQVLMTCGRWTPKLWSCRPLQTGRSCNLPHNDPVSNPWVCCVNICMSKALEPYGLQEHFTDMSKHDINYRSWVSSPSSGTSSCFLDCQQVAPSQKFLRKRCGVDSPIPAGTFNWMTKPSAKQRLELFNKKLGGSNSNISYFHPENWGRFPF